MHYMFSPHQLQENAYFMRVPPIYPRDLHHHPCSQRRRWSVENRPSCPGRSWAVQQMIYIQHPHAYVLAQASDVTFVTCYKWCNMASDSSDVTCYKYISLILYNHMWAMWREVWGCQGQRMMLGKITGDDMTLLWHFSSFLWLNLPCPV